LLCHHYKYRCFAKEKNRLKSFVLLFVLNNYLCLKEQPMTITILLGMIGAPQVILIIAVVLLLFGGRKIPELMRGLGSGIKEFKNATKEEEAQETKSIDKDKKA
jgi:sec-independent protein translocase protein TatA